ncbi:hypothetical protein EV688_11330 [Chromatocurvus halotolerans]|uniref:Tetratricopeptide repeat protein n=1 Tax=Chromatocurvus halotolerans TaxID=1132028 RepID=A0A4R2KTP8_9GAMM|nr:hypothetical protein EV688_11330 [Chromatocurvus halotolerans]
MLVASGVEVDPQVLAPRVYLPARQGSLQSELIAATRHHERVPYVLAPDLHALLLEIASGTPVLVMQNLGLSLLPQWHYAVVVGYDSSADSLLLRSGVDERLSMSRLRFEATWARAGRWAMVAASPSLPPVTAGHADWILAGSAFEELGQPLLAERAYQAATLRWPFDVIAWKALANARFAQDDLRGAESALRFAIRLAPSAAAHNNLANVLLLQGCLAAANVELDHARAMDDAEQFSRVLASTESTLRARSEDAAAGCTSLHPSLAESIPD